jgi:magnesium transporter
MRAITCRSREQGVEELSPDQAESCLAEPGAILWLDYAGISAEEAQQLKSMFDFHELALEDALKPHAQRSKVEDYDDHFFLVMHSLSIEGRGRHISLRQHELDLFVGSNYVVSIHHKKVPELDKVWEEAQKRPAMMSKGADRLAYYLLDAVVDNYLDIVDRAEDELDELEELVIDPASGESVVKAIFDFKQLLIHFRKTSGSLREAVNELGSRDFPNIETETLPYLRDVYDHLIRMSDMLDSYRDILTGALDVHLSAVSNRLNEIMKRLTVVATIFMPLAFITGFWGMNFTAMPFRSHLWFWGSLGFMTFAVFWMMAYFWRKHWY